MRVDLLKSISLSVLLSLVAIQAFVKCDEANNQLGELKGAQNVKGISPVPSSSKKVSPSPTTSSSEPRQRYQLKFLTPYSHYPVRLKDHYGRKGNTRWYKFGSQNFTDNIPNSQKFYSTENEWVNMGEKQAIHLLLMTYDIKSHFVLDHYEPTHQDANPRSSNQNYDYDYTFESNIGKIDEFLQNFYPKTKRKTLTDKCLNFFHFFYLRSRNLHPSLLVRLPALSCSGQRDNRQRQPGLLGRDLSHQLGIAERSQRRALGHSLRTAREIAPLAAQTNRAHNGRVERARRHHVERQRQEEHSLQADSSDIDPRWPNSAGFQNVWLVTFSTQCGKSFGGEHVVGPLNSHHHNASRSSPVVRDGNRRGSAPGLPRQLQGRPQRQLLS